MTFYILSFILLGLMAWFDYRTSKVPDILVASLWFVSGLLTPELNLSLVCIIFGTVWLTELIAGKAFGWADILVAPIWISLLLLEGIIPLVFGLGFLFIYSVVSELYGIKKFPLMPVMFVTYSIMLVSQMLSMSHIAT